MKVSDICIGDWVYVHEPECKGHRIDYINEMDEEVGADGEVYSINDIRPIPLTEDTLVRNGFVVEPYGCIWYQEQGIDFQNYCLISFRKNREIRKIEMDFVNKVRAEYRNIFFIHQLQHILKDIGKEIIL